MKTSFIFTPLFLAFKIKLLFCVSKYEDLISTLKWNSLFSCFPYGKFSNVPLRANLFILHSESKSLLLRMLSTSLVMLPSQVRQTTFVWCVRRPFSAPFLFFCLCFLSNVCLSPLIIYFISTSSLNTLVTKTLHSHSHFGQKTAVKVRRCQRNFLTFSLCPVDAFKT